MLNHRAEVRDQAQCLDLGNQWKVQDQVDIWCMSPTMTMGRRIGLVLLTVENPHTFLARSVGIPIVYGHLETGNYVF